MLESKGLEFVYRKYTEDPLSRDEVEDVLSKLGVGPRDVLRKRDAGKAGLDGSESDDRLIDLMAEHPTLLQRPILVDGARAALERPVENLEALLS